MRPVKCREASSLPASQASKNQDVSTHLYFADSVLYLSSLPVTKMENQDLTTTYFMATSAGPSEFCSCSPFRAHQTPLPSQFLKRLHLSISSNSSCFLSCLLSCLRAKNRKPLLRASPSIILKASLEVWLVFAAYVQKQAKSIWYNLYKEGMREGNDLTKGWSLVSVLQDMLSSLWAVRYFQTVKSFACRNLRYAMSFGIVKACLYSSTWEVG